MVFLAGSDDKVVERGRRRGGAAIHAYVFTAAQGAQRDRVREDMVCLLASCAAQDDWPQEAERHCFLNTCSSRF